MGLMICPIFLGDSLAEAAISLSAARLPGMAAAILQIFQFQPIVPQQQPEFPSPGLRAGQIGKKGPGAGAGFLFLTHGRCSCRLTLGVNVPGGVYNDVQFHAIVQLFLGSFFGALEGVQGTEPFITRAILNLYKALAAFRLLAHTSLLSLNELICFIIYKWGGPYPFCSWGHMIWEALDKPTRKSLASTNWADGLNFVFAHGLSSYLTYPAFREMAQLGNIRGSLPYPPGRHAPHRISGT